MTVPATPAERHPDERPPAQLIPVPQSPLDADRARVLERCLEAAANGRRPVLLPAAPPTDSPGELDLSWAGFLRCEVIVPDGVSLRECSGLTVIGSWELDGASMRIRLAGGGEVAVAPLPDSVWRPAPATLRSQRRREVVVGAACAAMLAVGTFMIVGSQVTSPFVLMQATPPMEASKLVTASDDANGGLETTGLRFATVGNRLVRWSELPLWWLRRGDDTQLVRVSSDAAAGLEESDAGAFEDARQAALLAAWEHAAQPLPARGVLVRDSAPGTGLRAGDVIVGANGKPVRRMYDLVRLTESGKPGDVLELELESGRRGATLWLFPNPEMNARFQISAILTSNVPWDEHPVRHELRLPEASIEGDSAGLATALYAWEQLTGKDLTRGRTVVATGTVDAFGRVGPVGGVEQKALAAARAGADVLIVAMPDVRSSGQYLDGAHGSMQVIGVDSLGDAISALQLKTAEEICGDCT